MRKRRLTVAWGLAVAAVSGGAALADGSPPSLTLSSYQARQTARHRLALTFEAGEPEIHRAFLTYAGFHLEGFDRLGAPGTPVGAYELDLNADGTADRTWPLLSLDAEAAWVDVHPDGRFSAPFEPLLRRRAAGLDLLLPGGGDGDPASVVTAFGATATLVLFEGLVFNPARGGPHTVVAETVSVDPESGGPDDGQGSPPQIRRLGLAVEILGPPLTPFERLAVDRFECRSPHDRLRFAIRGSFVPGAAGDGIDLASEEVVVAFDGFRQTLPGAAFEAGDCGHRFRGTVHPGIHRFRLCADGTFELAGRGLAPAAAGRDRVRFVLAIGNDRGEVDVRIPRAACGRR